MTSVGVGKDSDWLEYRDVRCKQHDRTVTFPAFKLRGRLEPAPIGVFVKIEQHGVCPGGFMTDAHDVVVERMQLHIVLAGDEVEIPEGQTVQ